MDIVRAHVPRVPQLPADGAVSQEGLEGGVFGVVGLRGRFEVLDEFAEAQGFADQAELGLESCVGCDFEGGCVEPVEVPGVEAGEVLQGAHNFVATDFGVICISMSCTTAA